jgi:V8-like Glu-specific endopeptidase
VSTAGYPHNCIGYLLFRNSSNDLFRGTGFLIAADLVLTVAHNAYNRDDGTINRDFAFYPGASGELTPATAYKVSSMRFPDEYRER